MLALELLKLSILKIERIRLQELLELSSEPLREMISLQLSSLRLALQLYASRSFLHCA
jgi:hypothetical protein